jgi:hypothetical protein
LPVIDSLIVRPHNDGGMKYIRTCLLVALCCLTGAYGQGQTSTHAQFAGCYEVVSLVWNPPDDTIKLIPKRFHLLSEPEEPSRSIFGVRSVPASGDTLEKLWSWKPLGSRLWISCGTGFGGFCGTLKLSSTGESVGKLKEWCDSRCGWKKRVGTIRIRKIDCTE